MKLRTLTFAPLLASALLTGCSTAELADFDQRYREHSARVDADQQQSNPMIDVIKARQGARGAQGATPAATGQSAMASWTGRSEIAQSVTGSPGFNCEFNYAGKTFWRMFPSSCPSAIAVQ